MGQYVRTTTVDSGPTGDSTKQAVLDVDTDLTGIVAAYNAHDTATTSVHGFTGTKTGSGAMVGATSPTLVTPTIGVATATSINKVAITAPATSATITMTDGKTLSVTNTLTFSGTDSTVMTFPSTSATIARTDAANTFTGHQTIEGVTSTGATGTGNLVFSASPTFTGTVTIPTPFTIGAVSMTATGTQLNYLAAATGTTGTTSTNLVFSTSPTLVTPTLGVATATSINKVTITAPATSATLTIADGASLITSGAYSITLTATNTTSVTLPTSGTLVSSVTTGNGVSATNTAGALAFTLGAITPTTVNGVTISGAGSLDVASGKTLNVDDDCTFTKGLTVTTNAGTLAFSAASKTLTVAESLTTPAVTGAGEIPYGSAANVLSSLAAGSDGQVLVSNGAAAPGWEYRPLQNLLTNSQFIAASGSTLVEAVSGAAPVTDGANAVLAAGNTLLINGGIDSAVGAEWTTTNSSALSSVGGGKTGNCLKLANPVGAGYANASQVATTVVGKLYMVSAWVYEGDLGGTVTLRAGRTANGTQYGYLSITPTATWTQYTIVFKATTTTSYVSMDNDGSSTANKYTLWDSITLHEVTPGYVAADPVCFDGWRKTGSASEPDVWRQHKDATYTKEGSFYSVKITAPAQDDTSVFYPESAVGLLEEYRYKFAGKTVTFGAWVWSASACKLCVSETDQYIDNNAIATVTYSAGSAWEWKEVTATFSATPAKVHFFLWLPTGATAYFSQPMLVFGSSIGRGNYQPIPNEVIWLQDEVYLLQDVATPAAGTFNVEALSSGKIAKGAKGIHLSLWGTNTAAAKYIQMYPGGSNYGGVTLMSQVANVRVAINGSLGLDSNGDFYYSPEDANWSAVRIMVNAIQT